jgi:pyruvate,orthophosphate dikinase
VEEALVRTQSKDLRDIDAGGMEHIVDRYRDLLADKGTSLPQDVCLQLKESAKSVYRSWYGEKADNFRRAMKVSAHWGTSITLMQMISGNSRGAGASVFFTRDPASLGKGIYGETREIATGDDLVYGSLTNRPLARGQTGREESLEEIDHDLYLLHAELAEKIEDAMGGLPQEVEAAYVSRQGRRFIYILQTKRMEFSRRIEVSFGESCRMESSIIGRGIGVHGGALSGIASFSSSADEIRKLKKMNNQPVILIRKEASTDDVSLMPEIDGIITAVGGVTSHAAILAQKFELTAVVSCSDMQIKFDGKKASHAVIGDYVVREGMPVSIDGATGLVYSGICLLTTQKERYG